MNDQRIELVLHIKEELDQLRPVLDDLHKEEASILHEIDAVERKAKEQGLHDLERDLLDAYTKLVAAGSAMVQVSVDLLVPPTVFESVLHPDVGQRKAS